jgi:glucose/arabinose dehydrogenase
MNIHDRLEKDHETVHRPVRTSTVCAYALAAGLGLALLTGCDPLGGKDDSDTETAALRPPLKDATDERVASLGKPSGFQVKVFARNLGHARMIAVAPDSTIYLTCPRDKQVKILRDADGDGVSDTTRVGLDNLPGVHGILVAQDWLYLAGVNTVWRSERAADGTLGTPEILIDTLPSGGQHPYRTLGLGPDGKLYISVGSTCNACPEPDPLHAAILRSDPDGKNLEVFASGLRNTLGFGWHPETEEMWGMDNGSDALGDDQPPEELNLLKQGAHYGWPYAWGKRKIDPIIDHPFGTTKEAFAAATEPSVLEYQAHSAPIGMAIYTGAHFPDRYRNGAFVAFRGSWNRIPATGYKIAFIPFSGGTPQGFEDFITGFLIEDGQAQFGRVAGVAMAADGSLLFTDDSNGVMYRVTYTGP